MALTDAVVWTGGFVVGFWVAGFGLVGVLNGTLMIRYQVFLNFMIPKYFNSYAGFVYSYPVVEASFAGVESGFLKWNMIVNCYISWFNENFKIKYYLVVGTTLAVVIMGFEVVAKLNISKQISLT